MRCFWAFCAALEFAIHGDTFEDATAVVVMLDGEEEKSRDIWREKVTLNPEKKSAGDQIVLLFEGRRRRRQPL